MFIKLLIVSIFIIIIIIIAVLILSAVYSNKFIRFDKDGNDIEIENDIKSLKNNNN